MPGATSSRTGASSRPSAWSWAYSCSAKPRREWGLAAPAPPTITSRLGSSTPAARSPATIEGNTSSAAGVVENGGCVQDKSYPLTYSKIGGYGRPDFSIVPEEDNDMDQTKFNEMFAAAMAEYRKQLRDNDSGDWSQKAREWAVSVGLFAGNGTLDNGEPNMMWEDFLTREQAAQLFYRFALEHGLA